MPSPIQWLYYALREGKTHLTADGSNHDWREDASFEKGKGQIYDHYTFYCDHRQEKPVHDGLFWKRIREVLGEIPERKPGKSTRIITLPSLASARKMFERYAKAEEDIWMI